MSNKSNRRRGSVTSNRSNGIKVPRSVPIGGHILPPLPYSYDALEPYIDTETMKIHYDILARGYVERLNRAELALKQARERNDFSLIQYWEGQLAFNGAGHYLHTLFWQSMTPEVTRIREPLASELRISFGSIEHFKQQFSAAAKKVEGPGWAVLTWSPRAWRVDILQAEKHQNWSQQDCIPLLVLDVWEHAYFLKYHADRVQYVDTWRNLINWDTANFRLIQAMKVRWRPC